MAALIYANEDAIELSDSDQCSPSSYQETKIPFLIHLIPKLDLFRITCSMSAVNWVLIELRMESLHKKQLDTYHNMMIQRNDTTESMRRAKELIIGLCCSC